MLVHRRVTPSIKFAGTHLYTWVERGTARVKSILPRNTTQCPQSGLEPAALAPESSALTMRPPHFPRSLLVQEFFFREIFLFEKVMDRPTQTPQKFSKIMTKSYSKTSQEVTLTITMRDRNHELII